VGHIKDGRKVKKLQLLFFGTSKKKGANGKAKKQKQTFKGGSQQAFECAPLGRGKKSPKVTATGS